VAVVLLGPDNILREARRVPPAADGSWSTGSLVPGRYRIQLDGGGNRVLVTRPPFLLVVLEPMGTVVTPEILVRKAR